MQDFTAGGIHALSARTISSGDTQFDERVRQLVRDWGAESPELVEQLIVTALKMARDKIGVADLKLANRALNELRYAARTFEPFRHEALFDHRLRYYAFLFLMKNEIPK